MKIVSIPDFKSFLEKPNAEQDALYGMLIDIVSKRIETYLNRQLVKQSRTMYFNAGRMNYFLPAYPFDLSAAFTVSYDGVVRTKDTDYFIWEDDGMVEFCWLPEYYKPKQVAITWTGGYIESPITEVTGTDGNIYRCILTHVSSMDNKPIVGPNYETYWSRVGTTGGTWENAITYLDHAYLAGAPDDLKHATLMQCSHSYRRRKDGGGLASISYPDGSKSFDTSSNAYRPIGRGLDPFLPEVTVILQGYRKAATER